MNVECYVGMIQIVKMIFLWTHVNLSTWPHSSRANCLVGCMLAHFRQQAVGVKQGMGGG